MRSYETEYQFPERHLNIGFVTCVCEVGEWARDWRRRQVEQGGGEVFSPPAHPTFMLAKEALLTSNKSTARSNLSQRTR